MQLRVTGLVLVIAAALGVRPSGAQVSQPARGQAVLEKIATTDMLFPGTGSRLDFGSKATSGMGPFGAFGTPYFLEGGTVVFWACTPSLGHIGLFSAKDGVLKTVAMEGPLKTNMPEAEGIPEHIDFYSPQSEFAFNTDIKAGGALLYITIRFGIMSQKTRSVCVWDGEKLRPVLWRGESPAWLGAGGGKIAAAEVVSINPDGSAMIVYSTDDGQYGIASHSKAAGLRPLISASGALPGMPSVTILKDSFVNLFQSRTPAYVRGEDWAQRWRYAPPSLLGDRLFMIVVPSSGHPFLARIGAGKTERILEAGSADPTDPGIAIEGIRSFKAVTPDVVAVEIEGRPYGRRLLYCDKGKFSLIYQSGKASEEVGAKAGFNDQKWVENLDPLQVLSPESKSFCALANEWHKNTVYNMQVRCFDGTRLALVTGAAEIGSGSVLRAIPGEPGMLVVNAQFLDLSRFKAFHHAPPMEISRWFTTGDAPGQNLRPVPELLSVTGVKFTLADAIGMDETQGAAWLRLEDGFYKMRYLGK